MAEQLQQPFSAVFGLAEQSQQPFSAVFGLAEPFQQENFYAMTGLIDETLHQLIIMQSLYREVPYSYKISN